MCAPFKPQSTKVIFIAKANVYPTANANPWDEAEREVEKTVQKLSDCEEKGQYVCDL